MDLLDSLIALHETDQRLLEIDELKGDLPSLLIKQKTEIDLLNQNQKTCSVELKDLKPVRSGDSDLKNAMKLVAKTGNGPKNQIPSMGCNIKWFK